MPALRADVRPETPPVQSKPAAGRALAPLVELSDVTRKYGRLVALRDVSLTVAPGEFVFLTGPSEAGKTTLLKLIHGDLRPTRGAIRVERFRLQSRWRRFLPRLRRRAAIVFQDQRLLPNMTASRNVAFALQVADVWMPNKELRARTQARLDEVGLGRRAHAFPRELSGGQQRRLAIARALAHDPVLLLADEPTANLDRRNAERVIELLERRSQTGTAVVVATHDLELARTRPHRVIELRQGRVVADHPARPTPVGSNGSGAGWRAPEPADDAPIEEPEDGLLRRTGKQIGRFFQLVLGYVPPPAPPPKPPRPPRVRKPRQGLRLRQRLAKLAPRRRRAAAPGPPRRRLRLGARVSAFMQWTLDYVPPPAPAHEDGLVVAQRVRRPRKPWVALANLGRLILGGAFVSWLRSFATTAPAMGSIALLLLLVGLLGVSGFAVRTLLVFESSEAAVLHVYLADDATQDQIDQLRHSLGDQPHVRSVQFVDKDQALARARQRPGLADLASLSDSNPFPASLDVQVDQANQVAAIAKTVAAADGVDQRRPTSYDQGTYDRLRQFTLVAAAGAGGFVLVLLFITYAVSSNSIRTVVLARRDELLTMQLVGASPWLVRLRLAVEGALTGGLAGLLAAVIIVGFCVGAFYGARQLFVDVLPGVTVATGGEVVVAIAALGMCIGGVAALFAFRRVRT
jgi:cell division transport system ATP-binding protein